MSTQWDEPVPEEEPRRGAVLISLHFIVNALRGRWRLCALFGLIGLVAALGFLLVIPPAHDAKASMVLAHTEGSDSEAASSTDLGLLETRTVSSQTVTDLGLTMPPQDFRRTFIADSVSSDLMTITLSAPSDAEAIRRLNVLTTNYLKFRSDQLTAQATIEIEGLNKRVTALQAQVKTLNAQIARLTSANDPTSTELADAVSQRTAVESKIDTLQTQIEDTTLSNNSVVSASRVIDPAAIEVASALRRAVLSIATGMIGGIALGCGIVLFTAVTSDRLRRRSDVALAAGVPVALSAGRLDPLPRVLRALPGLRGIGRRRADDRNRLGHALAARIEAMGPSPRVAIGCVDSLADVQPVAEIAARALSESGRRVDLVDLSDGPPLSGGDAFGLTVLRPKVTPALTYGRDDLVIAGTEQPAPEIRRGPCTQVVVAELDPVVGASHVATLADQVVLVVRSGRSSAERLRSVADQVRAAGRDVPFAVLIGSQAYDNSSGLLDRDEPTAAVDPDRQEGTAASESRTESRTETRTESRSGAQ